MSHLSRKKTIIISGLIVCATAAGVAATLPAQADATLSVVYKGDALAVAHFINAQCGSLGYQHAQITNEAGNADGSTGVTYRCYNA
jgi:hypothetical protein